MSALDRFFIGKMSFGAKKSVRFTECPLYDVHLIEDVRIEILTSHTSHVKTDSTLLSKNLITLSIFDKLSGDWTIDANSVTNIISVSYTHLTLPTICSV